jgi:hypothetical protein
MELGDSLFQSVDGRAADGRPLPQPRRLVQPEIPRRKVRAGGGIQHLVHELLEPEEGEEEEDVRDAAAPARDADVDPGPAEEPEGLGCRVDHGQQQERVRVQEVAEGVRQGELREDKEERKEERGVLRMRR